MHAELQILKQFWGFLEVVIRSVGGVEFDRRAMIVASTHGSAVPVVRRRSAVGRSCGRVD
ncbi:MAG: hypothetical protein DMF92_23340 [Acidobacteria bacterium]|nr:MAG: hypothetical protein DMF92_23340 [Acidobacteriota bacterium]